MMESEELKNYDAFILELDDVLYPEKDYLLQVYYLFAQFMEYTEQMNAGALLVFMKQTYLQEGAGQLFAKTAAKFDIPETYHVNFNSLLAKAVLPLKLWLFESVSEWMHEVVAEGKRLFLLLNGDPLEQLNKIKQIEWNGLDKYLTVYFAEETEPKPSAASLNVMIEKHQLAKEKILMIGHSETDQVCAQNAQVKFVHADQLF